MSIPPLTCSHRGEPVGPPGRAAAVQMGKGRPLRRPVPALPPQRSHPLRLLGLLLKNKIWLYKVIKQEALPSPGNLPVAHTVLGAAREPPPTLRQGTACHLCSVTVDWGPERPHDPSKASQLVKRRIVTQGCCLSPAHCLGLLKGSCKLAFKKEHRYFLSQCNQTSPWPFFQHLTQH